MVVEVGVGSGIYSCSVAANPGIKKIYALEYAPKTVELLMSYVIKKHNFTPEIENKIFPIVGSFDDIKLPDESVDYIIDVGSLHHSENREKTFRELYRILKPGGFLVGVDRCSSNTLSNLELQQKLNIKYSKEYKIQRGMGPDEKFTRRMNSEHDPILAEWEYLLAKTGFKVNIFWIYAGSKKMSGLFFKIIMGTFYKIFGEKMMRKKIRKSRT
ncbi:MAG: class I SAM-dependent methyltransferase [Ignavibacteriales bacterium]|nr:class I SAM-dependent methyltransferase [Melioribacteraceae bacterium]MCF8315144.1 class I SAM-dependent methyltransferase [Ignavibacteriales bacterium]MCF8435860.1 class I SAM-dependent methyltransferase [Ignavibacteriales bacterium]